MVDNIEKVLERGEKIELLVDKTDNLRFQVWCHDLRACTAAFWGGSFHRGYLRSTDGFAVLVATLANPLTRS